MSSSRATNAGSAVAGLIGLADAVADASTRAGRADLADRLQRGVAGLTNVSRQVLVTGEHKRGKSSFVNALLGVDLCPVDDDLSSAMPVMVRHGERFTASLVVDDDVDGAEAARGAEVLSGAGGPDRVELGLRHRAVGIDEARAAVADPPVGARWLELTAPRQLLSTSSITLIDAPTALGSVSSAGELTVAASRSAALTIVLSDATQELTRSEMESLRATTSACPNTLLVLTKTDLTRHWERVLKIDREHLDQAGLESVPVLATSALLRRVALDRDDQALNERSGYPALSRMIVTAVGSVPLGVEVVDQVVDVLAQLRLQYETNRRMHHEADVSAFAAELVEARSRADAMRRAGARWQQVLNDEIGTMSNDAEFELRGALRAVVADMEVDIAADDPARSWDDIRAVAEGRVTEVLVRHDERLMARADAVATRVGEHFAAAGTALEVPAAGRTLNGRVELASSDAPPVNGFAAVELAGSGVFNSALTALRGSYGSVMMFGLVSAFAGLTLINPITIVAGIGLGGKALLDDRGRAVAQRRQQARMAVRAFVDEAVVSGTKHTRDQIRLLHRELRDGFSARADERQMALDVAVREAQSMASRSDAERVASAEADRMALAEVDRLEESAAVVRAAIVERGRGAARG